jgi:hypothetical protein
VLDISCSDTEALLDSLFPCPISDSFEDWAEANDMAASVYIALSADASSSRTPVIDAPCDGQKSRFNDPSVQKMKKA